jgi:hypothetical protein
MAFNAPGEPFSVPDPDGDAWDEAMRRNRVLRTASDPFSDGSGGGDAGDDVSTALNEAAMPMADWQDLRAQQLAAAPIASPVAENDLRSEAPGQNQLVGDDVRDVAALQPAPGAASAAQPPGARFTKGQAARELGAGVVLDRIGIGEAPARPVSYDTTFGYGRYVPAGSPKLTDMTLDQVSHLQDAMLKSANHTPVGKYQIRQVDLADLRSRLNLSGSEKFTPEVQDRMARQILSDIGYERFIDGKLSAADMQDRIAGRWAAVANHAGVSHARQPIGTTGAQIQSALAQAKAEADHMITDFNADPYARGWR